MRREGRIHGSYVRESKHSAWPPVKAPNKPTSHSKCTGKCGNGRVRCKCCAFALPVDKSLNKTKGFVKAKAFNITSNYKMQEWRVCDSSPPSSSSSKKPILKVERSFCAWDQYSDFDYQRSDSECEDESQQDDDVEDQDEEPNSWTSEIVVPIETLLRTPKSSETVPDNVSEDVDVSTNDSTIDSDESWSGVDMSEVDDDMSDGDESWADDWSLVEEEPRLCRVYVILRTSEAGFLHLLPFNHLDGSSSLVMRAKDAGVEILLDAVLDWDMFSAWDSACERETREWYSTLCAEFNGFAPHPYYFLKHSLTAVT